MYTIEKETNDKCIVKKSDSDYIWKISIDKSKFYKSYKRKFKSSLLENKLLMRDISQIILYNHIKVQKLPSYIHIIEKCTKTFNSPYRYPIYESAGFATNKQRKDSINGTF